MRTAEFLSKLKGIFQNVIDAPKSASAEEIRINNAVQVHELFKEIRVQIKGSENLPYERGAFLFITTWVTTLTWLLEINFKLL